MTRRALIAEWSAKWKSAGIDDARREAMLLLSHILGKMPLSRLLARLDETVDEPDEQIFRNLAHRRANREPLAYLTGQADFAGLVLAVGPGVLVPRADSETVVEAAVERALNIWTQRRASDQPDTIRILDTCTGSGAIGIAIACQLRQLSVPTNLHLIDISETALTYARRNAAQWCAGIPVTIEQGDLFPFDARRFDLITVNPPYITETVLPGLMPEVSRHEPASALAGGPDGLEFYRRILDQAGPYLTSGGWLLLEHGYDQAEAVAGLIRSNGTWSEPTLRHDLGGNPRVTICRKED